MHPYIICHGTLPYSSPRWRITLQICRKSEYYFHRECRSYTPFHVLVSSKVNVMPRIFVSILREKVFILCLISVLKLFSIFHWILVYTFIFWHILCILGGKYRVHLFAESSIALDPMPSSSMIVSILKHCLDRKANNLY